MFKKIGLSLLTMVLVINMCFIGVVAAEEAVPTTTPEATTTTTSTENQEATETTENDTENTEQGTTEGTEATEGSEGTESEEGTEEAATETETSEGEDPEATEESSEQQPAAEAGITPDSMFYGFDRLMEQIQLLLTFGENAKVELLAKLADERLAEAEVMTDAEKVALAQQAINDFAATLKNVVENVEASTTGLTDSAKVDAALASLEALRAGFQERFETLVATIDQKIAEAEEAVEDEEEATEEDAEEAEEAEGDEGPAHLKEAIILVYNLPQDTFEVLMSERGMGFGQAKMVAILMGKLQAKQLAEAVTEDADETTTDDEAVAEEGTDEDQVAALNGLIDEILGMKTKGRGQVKKQLGLKGQAVGHILKQAGLVDADEAEEIEAAEEADDNDEVVSSENAGKGKPDKAADKGRGKGRGGK